jgi:putative tricarboxylic transport membrane protein
MQTMDLLITGFEIVLNPVTLLYIVGGTVLGVIFGAMPGVSASMAVVLAMTFTYTMSPLVSIAFLCAVYCSAITGGGITAILFKIPGTPSSAPTTFDGYPMAARGESGRALGIQFICSAIGGIFAAICMFLLTPQLAAVALKFGASELFAITFLGLSVLTALDGGNIIQTVISGLLGLFLATVGMDPLEGFARFTWGNTKLLSGIEMIPIMIGMFAITEVLKQTVKHDEIEGLDKKGRNVKTKLTSIKELMTM